jgi:integrase/recombinase XerD
MRGAKLDVDWQRSTTPQDNRLTKFRLFLQEKGIRDSTIESYVGNAKRYLAFAHTDHPSPEDYISFREMLHSERLSRSTLNQYGYAAKAYHEMTGTPITFKRISPNNQIPFYFSDEDVDRIFSVISNIKHLAMLSTLFYGCLRASELCGLNDEDLDINSLTLRINGKGGQEGLACISNTCANVLREYLDVRPPRLVEGREPLFYTDYGQRWRRTDLHYMFKVYKRKAGIEKRGGLHVFARHTPATLMIANGCDIRIVQEVLRHRDIRTTLRYAHVSDKTKREMYERYLTL